MLSASQSPGFLLLRDDSGMCFYLPPDESGRLMQIDLSDDMVVAQLFGNSAWLDVMEPLKVRLMRSGFGVGGSSRGG